MKSRIEVVVGGGGGGDGYRFSSELEIHGGVIIWQEIWWLSMVVDEVQVTLGWRL